MEPPEKPDPSDCCGTGCDPCILDIYEEKLTLYLSRLSNPNFTSKCSKNTINCISQTAYSVFELIDIKNYGENTFLFTFKFLKKDQENADNKDYILDFKPGQHAFLRSNEKRNDKYVSKPYTLLFNTKHGLSFDVLIKLIPGGAMSEFIRNFHIGEHTRWRGPYGNFQLNYKLNNIGMIAQGTGIAPMLTIIRDIVQNEDCETCIKLFFCCRNHENIYFRYELKDLSSYWNFNYNIFLSKQKKEFSKFYKEQIQEKRLDESDLSMYMQSISKKSYQILVCGSTTFNQDINDILLKCEIKPSCIYNF